MLTRPKTGQGPEPLAILTPGLDVLSQAIVDISSVATQDPILDRAARSAQGQLDHLLNRASTRQVDRRVTSRADHSSVWSLDQCIVNLATMASQTLSLEELD